MLHSYVYFTALFVIAIATFIAAWSQRGRAALVKSLPAFAFFALLLLCAEASYAIGRISRGSSSGSSTIYTCSMHPNVRTPDGGLCPVCHMELVPVGSAEAVGSSADEIRIDPTVVQNMGVRIVAAQKGAMRRTLRAFGQLQIAESRRFEIALKFDAFVEELNADTIGKAVESGETLFSIWSPDLAVAQAELIAARKSGDAQLLSAARQKLLLWDVPSSRIDELQARDEPQRTLPWTSPARGTLLSKSIVRGSPVAKGAPLLQFADLATLWLDAQIPADMLAHVKNGMRVLADIDGAGSREGVIVFVGPELDATSRTAVARIELDNNDLALRPGMYARLSFEATIAEDAIRAPMESVLDTGKRKVAWVAVGKGRFVPRTVRTGAVDDEGFVAIEDGIAAGEMVVVSGQFLIDSESRLREGTRKFQEEGTMPGGDLPPPESKPLSETAQKAIDALAAAYAKTSEQFVADSFDAASWQQVRVAADAAIQAVTDSDTQLAATELGSLLDKPATDLEAARVQWKKVSIVAIRLFELARPTSGAHGTTIYVHHCPMAEADWLQFDDKTRNPYYGSSMLECGEVRRSMPLSQGGGK
jgi:RND family efflux transporter MFP subunit